MATSCLFIQLTTYLRREIPRRRGCGWRSCHVTRSSCWTAESRERRTEKLVERWRRRESNPRRHSAADMVASRTDVYMNRLSIYRIHKTTTVVLGLTDNLGHSIWCHSIAEDGFITVSWIQLPPFFTYMFYNFYSTTAILNCDWSRLLTYLNVWLCKKKLTRRKAWICTKSLKVHVGQKAVHDMYYYFVHGSSI